MGNIQDDLAYAAREAHFFSHVDIVQSTRAADVEHWLAEARPLHHGSRPSIRHCQPIRDAQTFLI